MTCSGHYREERSPRQRAGKHEESILASSWPPCWTNYSQGGQQHFTKKPAAKLRDTATVINDVTEHWLSLLLRNPNSIHAYPETFYSLVDDCKASPSAQRLSPAYFRYSTHSAGTKPCLCQRFQLGHSVIKITGDTYDHLVSGRNVR